MLHVQDLVMSFMVMNAMLLIQLAANEKAHLHWWSIALVRLLWSLLRCCDMNIHRCLLRRPLHIPLGDSPSSAPCNVLRTSFCICTCGIVLVASSSYTYTLLMHSRQSCVSSLPLRMGSSDIWPPMNDQPRNAPFLDEH